MHQRVRAKKTSIKTGLSLLFKEPMDAFTAGECLDCGMQHQVRIMRSACDCAAGFAIAYDRDRGIMGLICDKRRQELRVWELPALG